MNFRGMRLSTLRSTLVTLFPRWNSAATWDAEYARGDWESLRSDEEFSRYAVILGYLLRFSPRPAVLDVGCGPARLLELIARVDYERYVGLDLSAEAIAQAGKQRAANASFSVGSAESFATAERFDAIVFNEVVYYLKDPAEVLRRYHGYLRPGGGLIVSMFECPPASLAWLTLGRSFDRIENTRVVNSRKRAWNVALLRPKVSAR